MTLALLVVMLALIVFAGVVARVKERSATLWTLASAVVVLPLCVPLWEYSTAADIGRAFGETGPSLARDASYVILGIAAVPTAFVLLLPRVSVSRNAWRRSASASAARARSDRRSGRCARGSGRR